MSNAPALRGSRIGAGPLGESERGEPAPREVVEYWCAGGHRTPVAYSLEAESVPDLHDCPRCGLPAGRDRENPPERPRTEVYKTHLAYAKERRSPQEAEALLEEALTALRARGLIR